MRRRSFRFSSRTSSTISSSRVHLGMGSSTVCSSVSGRIASGAAISVTASGASPPRASRRGEPAAAPALLLRST
jgi:hypothetical protein